MVWRSFLLGFLSLVVATTYLAMSPHSVAAQDADTDLLDAPDSDTTDAAIDTATDAVDTDTTDTIGTGLTSGVSIDAQGVLRRRAFPDPTGQLRRQRLAQSRAALGRDLTKRSNLRKISLNRLEAELARHIEAGRGASDAMRHLAGLQRLQYIFFYPETNDIVLAGPAEGWFEDISGRVVGMTNGRPVLELQDLIVALRAFPPGGKSTQQVFCSIDPTENGLRNMQQFLQSLGGRATPADTQWVANGLRQSLGMQKITVGGIAPNTHFAAVMVEADYRMKLIGIGLETPPVRMSSYVALANPSAVSRNALQRWYFVPDYQCVQVSEDELAMQLIGDGVKLVGEDEVVSADGKRNTAARASRASQAFVTGFTKKYPQLAARSPVYAQLRNLIDMLVAAAFIQDQDYYGQAGWSLGVFVDENAYPVETGVAPSQVASAVNALWKGRRLMLPIGGGVSIQPKRALEAANMLYDEDGQVEQARASIDIKSLPENKWWWD